MPCQSSKKNRHPHRQHVKHTNKHTQKYTHLHTHARIKTRIYDTHTPTHMNITVSEHMLLQSIISVQNAINHFGLFNSYVKLNYLYAIFRCLISHFNLVSRLLLNVLRRMADSRGDTYVFNLYGH